MSRPLYSQARAPGVHWIGGWVGPRACVDAVENRKKTLALPGIDPGPTSPSLYRVSYTGSRQTYYRKVKYVKIEKYRVRFNETMRKTRLSNNGTTANLEHIVSFQIGLRFALIVEIKLLRAAYSI
jgi:hypothetical protein